MLENVQAYLSKQGVKYIKPEKAGPHQEEMEDLKALGQAARKDVYKRQGFSCLYGNL